MRGCELVICSKIVKLFEGEVGSYLEVSKLNIWKGSVVNIWGCSGLIIFRSNGFSIWRANVLNIWGCSGLII